MGVTATIGPGMIPKAGSIAKYQAHSTWVALRSGRAVLDTEPPGRRSQTAPSDHPGGAGLARDRVKLDLDVSAGGDRGRPILSTQSALLHDHPVGAGFPRETSDQVRKTSRTTLVSLYSSPSAISSPSKRR